MTWAFALRSHIRAGPVHDVLGPVFLFTNKC